jgi:hypothetical protein
MRIQVLSSTAWLGVLGIGSIAFAMIFPSSAVACDDLADKLLSPYLRSAIQSLGCSDLGKVGVDVADHKLESVCYTSSGQTSTIEIVVGLHCYTSDAAFVRASISERVTADAQVRGADCSLQGIHVRPSGEIGKILVKAFDVEGRARKALQDGLSKMCSR